jgi:IclR family KDG regulon transcriptional repressor
MVFMLHSVSRAGKILDLFTVKTPEWGVSEAAKELGISKSTASELMATLAEMGLLTRTNERSYRLGWRLIDLSKTLLNTTDFYGEAHQELQTLVERWSEAGSISVFNGNQAISIERLQGASTVRMLLAQIGMQLPVYASGGGKVLLAHQKWSVVKRLLDGQQFIALTPNTITSLDALIEELEQIRRQGYAYDREEFFPGLCAISAPIRDIDGTVTSCISMLLSAHRFNQNADSYTDIVLRTANRISKHMGYRGKIYRGVEKAVQERDGREQTSVGTV